MLLRIQQSLTLFGAIRDPRQYSSNDNGRRCRRVLPSSSLLSSSSSAEDNDNNDYSSGDKKLLFLDGPFCADTASRAFFNQVPFVMRNAFDADALMKSGTWPNWQDIVDLACTRRSYDEDDDDDYEDDGGGDDEDLSSLFETIDDDDDSEDLEWFDSNDIDDDDMTSGISARLIRHKPGELDSFQADLGPFTTHALQDDIPEDEHWSLLVNDVDRYCPALADWMDQEFGTFLPRWRRDDAQMSIAPTGGGIGPHVDSYDVFLIQAAGTREWKIQPVPLVSIQEEMDRLIPGLSVRILEPKDDEDYGGDEGDGGNTISSSPSFVSINLKAGDVLYLPPRVIHWGTSTSDDCMTLSVGCRAPAAQELVARLAEDVLSSFAESATRRYSEGMLLTTSASSASLSPNPLDKTPSYFSLTADIRSSMKHLVMEAVKETLQDEAYWDAMVGKIVTEPKRLAEIERLDEGDSAQAVLGNVKRKLGFIKRTGGVSFATSQHVETQGGGVVDRLFANGEMWEITNDKKASRLFRRIEQGLPLTAEDHLDGLSTEMKDILLDLISEGFLKASPTR